MQFIILIKYDPPKKWYSKLLPNAMAVKRAGLTHLGPTHLRQVCGLKWASPFFGYIGF